MSYSITKVKTFRGDEGHGFNATLLFNGKPVADVDDMADGGMYRWRWLAKDRAQARVDEAALEAHVKTLPPLEINGSPLAMDADLFVSCMVEDINIAKQIARWCKTSVAWVEGRDIRRTKAPPSPALIANVAKNYPAAQILNTMPADAALALVKAVSL
ncbi:MAG: hypothetical protein AB7V08_14010 [Elusimicrobiales bacterium]